MNSITLQPRLLIRTSGAPASLQFGVARFDLKPLYKIERDGFGISAGETWYAMEAKEESGEKNAWDLCHELMGEGLGIAGAGAVSFAEPDLEQQWIVGREVEQALALTRTCERADEPDRSLPFDNNDPFWFRDTGHSQLQAARDALGDTGDNLRVRIAHFDTGFDPDHSTLPRFLRKDLQKNFVDPLRANDAIDRTDERFGNNLGHGTGTLGILAGNTFQGELLGGAALSEVVPIRVANSVVLFRNSAIVEALSYVRGLCASDATRIHVITMSMGGLASQAWADAVNEIYEFGVFFVAAAGNNFGNLTPRMIVYPARFHRVVAACGVMADGRPYADLPIKKMAGNYGPASDMATALSGYSPNTPWARLGCSQLADFDGRGTSSATPQVAAAAALWIQKHRAAYEKYSKGWMKVEAVRKALFESAWKGGDPVRLGQGAIRVEDAFAKQPAAEADLQISERDDARFALWRALTGLGVDASDVPGRALEVEALQLSQRSREVEILLEQESVPLEQLREALAAVPGASNAMRKALGASGKRSRVSVPAPKELSEAEQKRLNDAMNPPVREPQKRELRVFAYDPLLGTRLETVGLNQTVLKTRWEKNLLPGPVGEYLEVVDIDPASGCCYAPVDLNHPGILAQRGLPPSESDPRFHQQMVYAVAMNTIQHFEQALGRVALWAPREIRLGNGEFENHFVRRLRIHPHALREANAFYSPDKKALLFGYFPASEKNPGENLPGGIVFTCLSHDIVAHETTHALLDGLHRRFREPTNPDVLAFHEAFSDIVALFQHFTVPEALQHQIAKTRGDLGRQNMLGELAQQFGQATGRYGALRSAIGTVEDGVWKPLKPTSQDYANATEAHDRGAVLVAAIFDAFLAIYRRRSEDLIRLATGGTGVLPEGAIPVDLTTRLAQEASRTASQVLNMCIRALDFCPPIDLTFGSYLRALLTADRDLIPDDPLGYRVAFLEAFRRRGIYPQSSRSFSEDSVCWQRPEIDIDIEEALENELSLGWDLNVERRSAFETSESNAARLARWIRKGGITDEQAESLGFFRDGKERFRVGKQVGQLHPFEIHSVRPVRRVGPDGQQRMDLVVEVTQTWRPESGGKHRGGCTVVVSLTNRQIKYVVRKRVGQAERFQQQHAFEMSLSESTLANVYFDRRNEREPFAILHR